MSWCRPHNFIPLLQGFGYLQKPIVDTARLCTSTDGGLHAQGWPFSFITADLSSCPFCIGAGPVDMDPTTSHSSQPEMAGYAGLWEALEMLSILFPQDFQGDAVEIIIWADSSRALQRLQSLHSQDSNTPTYPADANFSSHIRWLWSQTPQLKPRFEWITVIEMQLLCLKGCLTKRN